MPRADQGKSSDAKKDTSKGDKDATPQPGAGGPDAAGLEETSFVTVEQAVTLSRLELLAAEHAQWLDAVKSVIRKGPSSLSTFLTALQAVRGDAASLDQRRDALARNRATCRASLDRLRDISHLLNTMDVTQLPRPSDRERHGRISTLHPLVVSWYEQALRKLDEADAILASPIHASFYTHLLLHLMEAFLLLRCLAMSPYTLAQCVACYYLPVGVSHVPLVQLLSPAAIPHLEHAGLPDAVPPAPSAAASSFVEKPWYDVAPDAVKAAVAFAHIAPSLRMVETTSESIAREITQRYWVQVEALTPKSVAHIGDATTLRVLLALHDLPPVVSAKAGDTSMESSVASIIAAKVSAPKLCDRAVHKPVAPVVTVRAARLEWTEDGFFERPGIRTPDGRLYSGGTSEPHIYFYRAGSAVEAQSLGMQCAIERIANAKQEIEAAALRRRDAVVDSEHRSRLLQLAHASEVERLSAGWATAAAHVWRGALAAHASAPRRGLATLAGASVRSATRNNDMFAALEQEG